MLHTYTLQRWNRYREPAGPVRSGTGPNFRPVSLPVLYRSAGLPVFTGLPVLYRSTGLPIFTGLPVKPVYRPVRSGLNFLDRYRYRSRKFGPVPSMICCQYEISDKRLTREFFSVSTIQLLFLLYEKLHICL